MDPDSIFENLIESMQKSLEHTLHEFTSINTGKASPSMVENLPVETYGSTMRVMEVAAVTTPDARTISIQPWDKGTMKDIEKAIQVANIGLNPIARGNVLICPLPELSGDRRKELVKVTNGMAEQGKIAVRAIRREAMDNLKKLEKDKAISEDDLKRHEKDVQEETDKTVKEIDTHLKAKEKELLQV